MRDIALTNSKIAMNTFLIPTVAGGSAKIFIKTLPFEELPKSG